MDKTPSSGRNIASPSTNSLKSTPAQSIKKRKREDVEDEIPTFQATVCSQKVLQAV